MKRTSVALFCVPPASLSVVVTVSKVRPRAVRPSIASTMFLIAGTPSSVVSSFSAPDVRASWKPIAAVCIRSVAAPKLIVTPGTVSGAP